MLSTLSDLQPHQLLLLPLPSPEVDTVGCPRARSRMLVFLLSLSLDDLIQVNDFTTSKCSTYYNDFTICVSDIKFVSLVNTSLRASKLSTNNISWVSNWLFYEHLNF